MERHAGHFNIVNLVAERDYNLEMFHGPTSPHGMTKSIVVRPCPEDASRSGVCVCACVPKRLCSNFRADERDYNFEMFHGPTSPQ